MTVDLFNDTDASELVHWHGQIIPASVDGAAEEKSLGVPAHGQTPAGDLYLRLMVRVPKERVAHEVIEKIDQAYTEDVRKDLRL